MGMFDRVWFRDTEPRCSEGHSLAGVEFQTKDLGCTMGDAEVMDGKFAFSPGGWGDSEKVGRMWMCGDCPQCVCFVAEFPHPQVYRRFIELVVTVLGTAVVYEDVSKSLAEWWMEDYVCRPGVLGPMSPEAARTKFESACERSRKRNQSK